MNSGRPTENSKILFVGLHGFLGRPKDWDLLFQKMRQQFPKAEFIAPDLFASLKFGPNLGLEEWAKRFNAYIIANFKRTPEKILLGYSMGGRLALHSLAKDFNLWQKIILLSKSYECSRGQQLH